MHRRTAAAVVPQDSEIDPAEAWGDGSDETHPHEVSGEQLVELFRSARAAEVVTARIERELAWWLADRGHPDLALLVESGIWRTSIRSAA